jgi:hypothetical protein
MYEIRGATARVLAELFGSDVFAQPKGGWYSDRFIWWATLLPVQRRVQTRPRKNRNSLHSRP